MTRFPQQSRIGRAAALALTLAASAALALPSAGAGRGQEAAAAADASRIVAIGGSVTEIVFALGEEERLAARDTTSVYPEAATELPDVGYMRQLSPEGVLSVDPDAIIALEGSGPPETIEVLKKASVPFVTISESFDRKGVVEKIRQVGAALGEDARAEKLAASVEAELAAAERATAEIGERKRVMFVLSAQGGKILASGQGTAADGIIKMAGGVNAISGFHGYKQLTDEAVIAARPDMILTMASGGPGVSEADLASNPAIAATPAGQAGNFVRMESSYLLGFGPRTAGAVRDLAHALYGDPPAD